MLPIKAAFFFGKKCVPVRKARGIHPGNKGLFRGAQRLFLLI